jgi:hypothetical protein
MRKMLAALLATAAVGAGTIAVAPQALAASKNAMTVTATENAYGISGSLKPGFATITFKNEGKEVHVMALVHLKKGKTAKDFAKAIKAGDEAGIGKISVQGDDAIGAPFILTPGHETEAVTDTMKPGVWGMLCFIPDASGTPHLAKGMYSTFTVKGKAVKTVPAAQAEVTLTDTGITVPPQDAPSTVTLKITNEGENPHSFVVVKLNGSSTVGDLNTYFNSTFQGGPWPADAPGEVVGGIGDLKPQGVAFLTWKNLPAGHYGYLSVTGDAPDDDVSKGLSGEFNIS